MLKGKVAVVTGSTSGIGLNIAKRLADAGCKIVLNGFGDADEIENIRKEMAETYGTEVIYSAADMTKPNEVSKMIRDTEKKFGQIDILINNAGIQYTAPVEDFPTEKWDAIIAVNMSSAFHAIRAALPGMQQRNFGRIINISSVHGLVASEEKSAYVAAKHGIMGLTKVVALENAKNNITCNAICPGWVHTPLVQKQIEKLAKEGSSTIDEATKELLRTKQPSLRFTQPEDIGDTVIFLCSDPGRSMTGVSLTLDGGWTAQ